MSRLRVLVTCPPALATIEDYERGLGSHGLEVVPANVVQSLSEDQLVELLPACDAIVAGDDPLTARVLESAPRLRVIARWGVGMDNVDMAAADALGIRVVNTPGVFADEVADVAIGYLILIARQLHRIDSDVRGGGWSKPSGRSLAGMSLGLVGLGSIGRAIARRAIAMGMIVRGMDVSSDACAMATADRVVVTGFENLLASSEVVVLASALTAENRHLIDRDAFDMLPHGAWLINVARGALVDEIALVEALRDGRIGAAALDVYEAEPPPADSPLRGFDQVVLGSHNASNTREAVRRVNHLVIRNVLHGLAEVSR